jgi:diguanylate cyclase (GGDEF)-like protein/PAS domain S-box-containing protein
VATIGEIFRWLAIQVGLLGQTTGRMYRRAVARALRSDKLVASSERKFRALLESAPDAMVIVDWHGHITLVNHQAERMFGYVRHEIVGQNIAALIPSRYRATHREHLKGYLRDAHPREMGSGLELFALHRDGTEIPVEISLGPLETDQGMLVSAAIRDITARKRADAALRAAEERFRTAFEEAPVGMALARLDGRILQVNRALCEIIGYSAEQLEATTLESICHPDEAARDHAELERLVAGDATRYRTERRYIHSAGHPVPVDLSVAVVRDGDGVPLHFLAQVNDITERKRFEGQLQYLADHDALTGMLNRRRFEQELGRELARSNRYGSGGAVLAIDLDHFKYVNDSLGHSVGDELITRVGSIFRDRLRATDVIARLGGDEFAVILPGADEPEAVLVAESLLRSLRDEGRIDSPTNHPKRVTASIGVALFAGARVTSEEILVEADIAMYDAKEAGRDRIRVYDSAQDRQERMRARLTWADRIRDALDEDRFVLHAQPIVGLAGDETPRHELLIRMLGEGEDLVPPGTFLYIGERFDLIQGIDRWVLRQAIALLAGERQSGRDLNLAVNVSAKSVTDPTLPEFLARELANAGIDGQGLCVEVTETAAIVNLDRAKRFAHALTELGCEFALDDFGAGFASFYYLKHMAFDFIKIDGEFIRDLAESRVNQLVVRSVVAIARGMGKRTIAESVEAEDSLALLRSYGVDYAQGFYLAKPQPLADLGLGQGALSAVSARSNHSASVGLYSAARRASRSSSGGNGSRSTIG